MMTLGEANAGDEKAPVEKDEIKRRLHVIARIGALVRGPNGLVEKTKEGN